MATILVSTQSMFDVSCVIDNNYYRLLLLYIHVLYIDGYHFVVKPGARLVSYNHFCADVCVCIVCVCVRPPGY